MRTIWKFTLTPDCTIEMPAGAKILAIQEQWGMPQMWALVDPAAYPEKRRFLTYGTGYPINENVGGHVGTFQLNGGALVFHVFEAAA